MSGFGAARSGARSSSRVESCGEVQQGGRRKSSNVVGKKKRKRKHCGGSRKVIERGGAALHGARVEGHVRSGRGAEGEFLRLGATAQGVGRSSTVGSPRGGGYSTRSGVELSNSEEQAWSSLAK